MSYSSDLMLIQSMALRLLSLTEDLATSKEISIKSYIEWKTFINEVSTLDVFLDNLPLVVEIPTVEDGREDDGESLFLHYDLALPVEDPNSIENDSRQKRLIFTF